MLRETKALLALGALMAASACSVPVGEEPLYVLRDSMGRSVAMAGRSQLGDAAPGTMVRASIGGSEQELMVGERIGMGPVHLAQNAPPAAPPVTEVAATFAAAPSLAATAATPAAGGRAARRTSSDTAARAPRRAGPPPRSVSRSVM